jgi:hypothetical protein
MEEMSFSEIGDKGGRGDQASWEPDEFQLDFVDSLDFVGSSASSPSSAVR